MEERSPRDLYLELLKDTLTYSLWDEPPRPCSLDIGLGNPLRKHYYRQFSRQLEDEGIQLCRPVYITRYQRENGMIWPGQADTMVGRKRLDNLQYCIETVLRDGIEGDLLEAGVWRGGAAIFMRAVLAAHGIRDRKVFVADSFRGLPPPRKDCPADNGDRHFEYDFLAVTMEEVRNNFRRYRMLDDQVVFISGWFEETLPAAPLERIAVLRADGDMYSSTMAILDNLYPRLQPGGFCIIDDYGALSACKKAVDDFREANLISEVMVEIDWTGRFWRKG